MQLKNATPWFILYEVATCLQELQQVLFKRGSRQALPRKQAQAQISQISKLVLKLTSDSL